MTRRTLLLSIKQVHAEQIFSGNKKFEMRRIRPALKAGDTVIIYVPSPERAVLGWFTVEGIVEGRPATVWKKVRKSSGLKYSEYTEYYQNAEFAFAIQIGDVKSYAQPWSLPHLREIVPGFRPPQAYHYLKDSRMADVKLLSVLSPS